MAAVAVGADPQAVRPFTNESTALSRAFEMRHLEVAYALLPHCAPGSDPAQRTPLRVACSVGDERSAKWMLDNGWDPMEPDFYGYQPAHAAADSGSLSILQLLAGAGAGAGAGTDMDARSEPGQSPLHRCAFAMRCMGVSGAACATFLLSCGADPDRRASMRPSDGPFRGKEVFTPREYALAERDMEMAAAMDKLALGGAVPQAMVPAPPW